MGFPYFSWHFRRLLCSVSANQLSIVTAKMQYCLIPTFFIVSHISFVLYQNTDHYSELVTFYWRSTFILTYTHNTIGSRGAQRAPTSCYASANVSWRYAADVALCLETNVETVHSPATVNPLHQQGKKWTQVCGRCYKLPNPGKYPLLELVEIYINKNHRVAPYVLMKGKRQNALHRSIPTHKSWHSTGLLRQQLITTLCCGGQTPSCASNHNTPPSRDVLQHRE